MSLQMRPGALRHRITLQQIVRVGDDGGGFTESWSDVATVWAAIEPESGTETVQSARITGTVNHIITLRYRDDVVPVMRFVFGSRIFEILAAIDPDESGRWLRCSCQEREL